MKRKERNVASIEALVVQTLEVIEKAVRLQVTALKPALLTGVWEEQIRETKETLEHAEGYTITAERHLAQILSACVGPTKKGPET